MTYYDYYEMHDESCPESAVTTDRKLVLCDGECPCPEARPTVMYEMSSNSITYLSDDSGAVNVNSIGNITLTNMTQFTITNFIFTIEDYAVVVPDTNNPISSGESGTYSLYAPMDALQKEGIASDSEASMSILFEETDINNWALILDVYMGDPEENVYVGGVTYSGYNNANNVSIGVIEGERATPIPITDLFSIPEGAMGNVELTVIQSRER